MKLRNKETGEVKEVIVGGYPVSGKTKMWECSEMDVNEETGYKSLGTYASLAELNEEWEDYEEPKLFYVVDLDGEILPSDFEDKTIEKAKELGNYFETKEEAEKAVEKLKALKRLKDNGMIKYSFHKEKTGIDLDFYTLTILAPRDKDSLDLLFGGEE